MAVLVGLIGIYIYQTQQALAPPVANYGQQKPLDGENEIRKLSVRPHDTNGYVVDVSYRYRGDLQPMGLRVYAVQTKDSSPPELLYPQAVAQRGVNTQKLRLWRRNTSYVAHSTRYIRVEMFDINTKRVIRSKDIEYPIDWPRIGYVAKTSEELEKDVDALYREAVAEIDYGSGNALKNARIKLETIIAKDTRFVPAYPELARYYMKTNWGPEGRRQAERALLTGLAVNPDHANSHVLIGYVYAHQGRYKEAKDAFTKAADIGTENLWLWANWGELLVMQGQVKDSIKMYRKALEGDRPYNTYDRARKDAYRHLIDIYNFDNNVESADKLHLARIGEYGNEPCFPYYYAKFRQRHAGDSDTVLEYARKSLNSNCRYEKSVRKVIGSAYYSKWYTSKTPEEKQSYLAQAQSFFAEGPELIYWLAKSENTAPVIKALLDDGISIDIADNNGYTALAYAVRDDDLDAVTQIVALGGNTNLSIGGEKIPLLALAVMNKSKKAVEFLVANGADISVDLYGGVSLLDLAEGMGYADIVELLKSSAGQRI